MIRLVESRCINPFQHHHGPIYSLDFGSYGKTLSGGCGGPYRDGDEVDPRSLPARLRLKLQDELAAMAARGEVDRTEAEAFLDRAFRGHP